MVRPVAKTTKPKTKSTKAPASLVRALVDGLELADVAQQVSALHDELGALDGPRASAAAAQVLAETRKGAPVARAYLTMLAMSFAAGPSPQADLIVQHCATMERGRKVMKGAFVAIWRRAGDLRAVQAACANFERGMIDDPELLDIVVEVARRLGDDAALADGARRLERATRLRPLLAALAGAAPERARAAKQLAALTPDDRRHVWGRVVDAPRTYDQVVALAAVGALVDDPRVSDMCLSGAIAEMRYHGNDELVAAWKARVATGDDALVARLLGLFEWTALWATDDDQLEPYIRALAPASGRPEVFEQVEGALASEREVVREAVCAKWLQNDEARAAFDDQQIDTLVRMAVAIAEAGSDTSDRRAANRALFYVPHPGARRALMDALTNARTNRNKELRWNLYSGLEHIDHPDVLPFLVERLFVEREEFRALFSAIGHKLDGKAHAFVVDKLRARDGDANAIRAATLYADLLVDRNKPVAMLCELAAAVAGWKPKTTDDKRRLRYLLERATIAALDARRHSDARTLIAAARALPDSVYSDFIVLSRDDTTPRPLADGKQLVAALDSGALERQIADIRAQVAAARAAGKPVAADDVRLGALAGCKVAVRFVTDATTHEVWFWDATPTMHVYDGFEVVPTPCEVTLDGFRTGRGPALEAWIGARAIDDRALLMPGKKQTGWGREALLLGDRVLVFEAVTEKLDMWGRWQVEPTGFAFGDAAQARRFFELVANNPPNATRLDPWYVPGTGAIRRGYSSGEAKAKLAVLGRAIDGNLDPALPPLARNHASSEAAIAAMQAWEAQLLAAGGEIDAIWIDAEATRREDTVLAAFFEARYRDDDKGAAWHLRALDEIHAAVAEAGLASLVPDVEISVGPPATDGEIEAYQALVAETIPDPLAEVWREVGGGGFACARTTIRFLSPSELVAKRNSLRAALAKWVAANMKGSKLKAMQARLSDLDVVATVDGEPLILFDTRQSSGQGRCFASAGSDWWESALGWQIATDINAELKRELEMRIADVFRLRLGQRAGDKVRRIRLAKGDKKWDAVVDGSELLTRTATARSPGKPSIKRLATPEAAAKAFDAAVAAARAKGYRK
jgi:hypothetical protein